MNMIAIFAVMNSTWVVVKIRPEKLKPVRDLNSAIPVQYSTNYPFPIKIHKDPSPRGSRTSGSFPLPRIPFRISVCVTKKVSVESLPLVISKAFLRFSKILTCSLIQKSEIHSIFSFFISFFLVLQPVRALTLSNEIA